ncbi:ABC transporter ATP-binding protein [Photobacterium lipolyticum]|uniref:Macrolide ABC transporter ATP-binding protein n=1 Tax=Photobacterium lipolyticum TaxID=266810 RepID=A0A2T3N2M7_9GAMM|nr:ABC transporter ATP-binding protein [Photobacterium lipolyticum]PSW06630.1 macrolide ABC transporter ATP-binding protein [Photobacterium lipolyticum]
MSEITCSNVSKTFIQGNAKIKGLDNVSLTIDRGEFVCLSGPSGSGKTTLLNTLGGLLSPDQGEISIGNEKLTSLDKDALADMRLQRIGFVFQSYNLIPVLSARENVEFVMQVQGIAAKERQQKANAMLKEVGLEGMENRRPAELSGGQQQRVAVARAIVSNPALILADEPTANLDSHTAENLMGLLETLNRKHQITLVLATHDPRIMNYARRQIKMEDGKIIADYPTSIAPEGPMAAQS